MRHGAWFVVVGLMVSGCTHGVGSDQQRMTPTISDPTSRVDVYEPLIRRLVDPEGTQPIYIDTELCFALMPSTSPCPGRLSRSEREELRARLRDLGTIVFTTDGAPPNKRWFRAISLSPIVEKPDGLRVEGGTACSSMCGTVTTYILAATSDGWVVTGTDDTYGVGVA